MNDIKVLIISSCSGEKKININNPAIAKDIDNIELKIKKEEELKQYKLKAEDMLISNQNLIILEAVNNIKNIDISYLSSAYGIIDRDEYIIPYDINFSVMSLNEIDKRSEFLRVNKEVYYKCKKYDLVFFLLNSEYIRFLNLPLNLSKDIKQVFIISTKDDKFLSNMESVYHLSFSIDEIYKLNMHISDFRGNIIKIIAREYNRNQDTFLKIYNNPNYIRKIIDNYFEKEDFKQLDLFNN